MNAKKESKAKRAARRKTVAAGAGALVLIVAAALAAWAYIGRATPPPAPFLEEIEPPVEEPVAPPAKPAVSYYVEVVSACGPYHNGELPCVNLRNGPSVSYPVVTKLRTGVVLKVERDTVPDEDPASDRRWHKIIFDGFIRYRERAEGDWYIVDDPAAVRRFENVGQLDSPIDGTPAGAKRIVVDLSDQTLSAYDGDDLFMERAVSTGHELTPTPRGRFSVFRKTPSRYMQGPLPGVSEQEFDLPGVPWNLYFTVGGAVIHGAYWHSNFGIPWSHGCVNLPPADAKELYEWAELGTIVIVRD